jgi:hypothetical protein
MFFTGVALSGAAGIHSHSAMYDAGSSLGFASFVTAAVCIVAAIVRLVRRRSH